VTIISVIVIGFGLSMDCFAVSIGIGVSKKNIPFKKILFTSIIFGLFHFIMPLFGWLIGESFKNYFNSLNHWIAFFLLCIIGVKMITDALKDHRSGGYSIDKALLVFALAVATSIDAFIVGMPLALLDFNKFLSLSIISFMAFSFSFAGFYFGKKLGLICGNKAEIIGGLLLIGIGIKILAENFLP